MLYREPATDRHDYEDNGFQQLISEGCKPTGLAQRFEVSPDERRADSSPTIQANGSALQCA
jgi:hypothetical protein